MLRHHKGYRTGHVVAMEADNRSCNDPKQAWGGDIDSSGRSADDKDKTRICRPQFFCSGAAGVLVLVVVVLPSRSRLHKRRLHPQNGLVWCTHRRLVEQKRPEYNICT